MKSYTEDEVALVRNASVFDGGWYVRTYPDVTLLEMDPAEHYLWAGADLGRNPSADFNTLEYWEKHPRLASAGGNPVLHWLSVQEKQHPEEAPSPEPTHVGPIFDAEVARAMRRTQPSGVDRDYDEIRENFDVVHYLLRKPGLLNQPDFHPIQHFLRHGKKTRQHTPDINFSMKTYLERHPELSSKSVRKIYLHWLRDGRPNGQIADPAPGLDRLASILDMSEQEVVNTLAAKRLDLQERLRYGRLGEMFAKAVEVEPLVAGSWPETTRPKLFPFANRPPIDMLAAIHKCQRLAGWRRARLVLVINRPRWGGGRRIEGHLAHALAADALRADDIVIIYTDKGGSTPRDRYPNGVREVDLAGVIAEFGLDSESAQRVLVELLRSFHAAAIVNINSRLLYRTFVPYGRALAQSERIFLTLFCNEQGPIGNWWGYPARMFYRYFDLVEGVITDSHYLRNWLIDHYQLGPRDLERMHVFSAPVEPDLPRSEAPEDVSDRRPQVFWAGRWDRQKRIDVVLEVARQMPDVDFRMWGEPLMAQGEETGFAPPNLTQEGRYSHLSELPLDEADVWLYTSGWDGVPSQLLEVAMTEVPIVSTLVGGTDEVLLEGLSWRVDEQAGATQYIDALRDVLSDAERARKRSRELRAQLIADRTQQGYAQHARAVLLDDGQENCKTVGAAGA